MIFLNVCFTYECDFYMFTMSLITLFEWFVYYTMSYQMLLFLWIVYTKWDFNKLFTYLLTYLRCIKLGKHVSLFTNHTSTLFSKRIGNRVPGLLIAKSKVNGGMPYDCFTKLYDAFVISIITYGSAIWGFREYTCITNVHNRACRYFLGYGRCWQ